MKHINNIRKILTLIFITITLFSYSQDTLLFDSISITSSNSITGMYSKNSITQFNITYSGDNTITKKYLVFNTNTAYSLVYSTKIIANEWQQKTNVSYKNIFLTHVFNHSLTRAIDEDNSFGLGISKRWRYIYLSYASLYQNTNYSNVSHKEVIRHSIRLKLKYEHKHFKLSSEYYYQPNMRMFNDVIVYGNTKLMLLQNKKINVTMSDNVNYRTISNVRLMHTLTLGLTFNFKNN